LLLLVPVQGAQSNYKATTGGCDMVEDIGFRILVPIFVFSIIIVGGYLISNAALIDVLRRRKEEERS